jgi:hypothetical protein
MIVEHWDVVDSLNLLTQTGEISLTNIELSLIHNLISLWDVYSVLEAMRHHYCVHPQSK